MMSGVASKIRKLSSKSSLKNHTLTPSGENGKGSKSADKASKDVERTLPASKNQKAPAKKSLASVRESNKDNGKQWKSKETRRKLIELMIHGKGVSLTTTL